MNTTTKWPTSALKCMNIDSNWDENKIFIVNALHAIANTEGKKNKQLENKTQRIYFKRKQKSKTKYKNMAYLPSIKMMPTALVLNAWFIVIVIVSLFATVHISNAQAWTQDVAPTLKIKYGEFFFSLVFFHSHESFRSLYVDSATPSYNYDLESEMTEPI